MEELFLFFGWVKQRENVVFGADDSIGGKSSA